MIKKKIYASIFAAIFSIAISSFSVNAATNSHSKEEYHWLGFNDYGWVLCDCRLTDSQTYTIDDGNVKSTGRTQFARIEVSRTDLPRFSPWMTDLVYCDADDNIKKKLNMKSQSFWRSPSWKYADSKADYTTEYNFKSNTAIYSKFQLNVASAGSIFAGFVVDFKYRVIK